MIHMYTGWRGVRSQEPTSACLTLSLSYVLKTAGVSYVLKIWLHVLKDTASRPQLQVTNHIIHQVIHSLINER
jgi:hypothetical protein